MKHKCTFNFVLLFIAGYCGCDIKFSGSVRLTRLIIKSDWGNDTFTKFLYYKDELSTVNSPIFFTKPLE